MWFGKSRLICDETEEWDLHRFHPILGILPSKYLTFFKHEIARKDSHCLIFLLEFKPILPDQTIFLPSADIVALYPTINIENGTTALL